MNRFSGKTAIVGGGLGKMVRGKFKLGLSAYIAKNLAEEGANVILVDLDHEIAKTCAEHLGENVIAMPCDLMKERLQESETYTDQLGKKKTNIVWKDNPALELVHEIIEKYHSIDILITNFDSIETGRVENLDDDVYDKLLEGNITPVFHLLAAVRDQMSHQKKDTGKYGKVVMITSMVGKAGMSIGSLYSAFKGSIIALTKTMGREFSRFANVNSVACGPFSEKRMQGPKDRIKTKYAMTSTDMANRDITFAKVAPMVCFLASEDAEAITGQIISVDGGLWLKLEQ